MDANGRTDERLKHLEEGQRSIIQRLDTIQSTLTKDERQFERRLGRLETNVMWLQRLLVGALASTGALGGHTIIRLVGGE